MRRGGTAFRSGLLLAALLLAVGLPSACGDANHYEAQGVVRDVRPEWKQVVIEHQDIPGLMPAMTMNFDVEDPELLARLERGQVIDFTLEADDRGYRVVAATTRGLEGPDGAAGFEALIRERDPAPAFSLTNQAGAQVSLDSLRGKVLLLDFIYTRCPGPCPVLTARHVALQRKLPAALRERVRFVSISLDPAHDTPEALRAYAEARGADLSRWHFLTGPPDTVAEVVSGFGVGSLRQPDGEIDHLVVTFVVDAEGRIAERYVGLEHEAESVLRDLERLAG